jgi:DHA2 family multidrug resistance protein
MIATTMQLLDGTVANVALPHMQGTMSAAQDQITWVITSYVVMAGICTPLTGFIVSRFGRKRLFLYSVGWFTLTSMMCGAAQSLEQLVIFRLMQGASGAFLTPLSQSIVMDIYPPEKRNGALVVWGMGTLLAPILGPTVGAYLTETLSWRWAFYINLPLGILSIVGAVMFLPESKRDANIKFDLLGFAFLGTAIGSLQMMLDRGTMLDWFASKEIIIELVVGALAFYLFIVHMFTAPSSLLSRAAFKDLNYVIGLTIAFVVFLVGFGTNAIVPTMLQSLIGYPVVTAGILMVPRSVGGFFSMVLAGRLARYFDPRLVILVGLAITAFAQWQISRFTLDVNVQLIVVNGIIQGFGSGIVFVPLMMVIFSTLDSRFFAEGASMFSLVRNLGTAIGVSMDATLITQNTQLNHAELVEHITPFSRALKFLGSGAGMDTVQGAAIIEREVTRQAGMLAYNSLFLLSAYMVAAVAIVLPFIRLRRRVVPVEPITVEI